MSTRAAGGFAPDVRPHADPPCACARASCVPGLLAPKGEKELFEALMARDPDSLS
jgi:hypothetical protein